MVLIRAIRVNPGPLLCGSKRKPGWLARLLKNRNFLSNIRRRRWNNLPQESAGLRPTSLGHGKLLMGNYLFRCQVELEDVFRVQMFAHVGGFTVHREVKTHNSRRPSIDFNKVISSAYSMSLPTGMPMAIRVTLSPARRSFPER